ncbi:hypothetical protein HETIRDRAFT_419216 [Heterobasidion irregulare TC 32-1]|uniref:Uncharacterized protein n=1 Tax=Heterobasidion irregulare (strain TC 32-1) TaxID=747525 RepID=W4K119_HETIT|nr:uncharacterized protein HETIRDRAFT_419216 [Heterobasidion irregulare TC 32-1]ETW79507.1 hypothetical protein HETIRDRAFT_419216 [Heterobasidion irregulare TC 32-1]
MAASIWKNIECKSSSCNSPNKKWPRAGPSNHVPAEPNETENCLITRDLAADFPVYLCHVFHERYWSNHPMLSRLEWAWGMKYDTIKMDVDSNMISLRHDWRDLFESDRWALMPSMDIIEKLWDRWDKFPLHEGNVPSIEDMYDGAEIFEYRLVPVFPNVPPVSRCNGAEHISGGNRDDTVGATVYSYPFDTLPPIFSRVKPHFVVLNAGRKLDMISYKCCTTTPAMARIYGVPQK